jgi:hypothetical protein
MTLNIYRKIILVIAFLSTVSILASPSIINTLASLDDSGIAGGEQFKVLVTVAGVEGNCGEIVKITVAFKSETFDLCEGDERPSEEQRADPMTSQEYQFEFPKGEIAVGEFFDVCVEGPGCKTLTNSPAKKPEKVTFSID